MYENGDLYHYPATGLPAGHQSFIRERRIKAIIIRCNSVKIK